jgi:TolB protein
MTLDAHRRALLAALGTAGALGPLAVAPALAQFRIEVTGVGATQVPMAVATFRDEQLAGLGVSAIVRADLARSGLFRLIDVADALDERSLPVLGDWRQRGTDALVGGSVTRLPDGRFELRYKLWDVVRGEELVGKSQTVVAGDLRLAAHRIADEIHQNLIGEPGVFATRIAYVVQQGPQYALLVTDADGENAQVALNSLDPIISPAWAPDGRQLAYVSFESQKAVVWVQDTASGKRRILANFRGSNSAPAWAPDGSSLTLALSQGGSTQLWRIGANGGAPVQLTTSRSIDTEPVYTPDGSQLYFVSDRGGGPQIYRMPAQAVGAPPERVTFDGDYNTSPALSPDGRMLAYISRVGSSAFKLMTLDLGTGTVRAVTATRDDESPSFAPNSRLIVYATRLEGRDVLMTTTLDGRIKTRLLTSGADVREPAWGPYGR